MAGEVFFTREYAEAFIRYDDEQREELSVLVGALQADVLHPKGVLVVPDANGTPVRELRSSAKGASMRVWYALDPFRDAILLLTADKAESGKGKQRGGKSTRWSERHFVEANRIFTHYLFELARGHGRRVTRRMEDLRPPEHEHESLVVELVKVTGWKRSEVVKMMRRGGPLDPNTPEGEDRILDWLTRKPKTDGLSGFSGFSRRVRNAYLRIVLARFRR